MRTLVLVSISLGVVMVGVGGCRPITWMDGADRVSISEDGPSLGTLRHRERRYDLRKITAAGTSHSDDSFIQDFNSSPPMARGESSGFDARNAIDAVAVEDLIADVDRP